LKNAYVSFVITAEERLTSESIRYISALLKVQTRDFEILVAQNFDDTFFDKENIIVDCPITLVNSRIRSTPDQATLAALSRAAGDFVIEWRGLSNQIDSKILDKILKPTDEGFDLVEVITSSRSLISRFFIRVVNIFRPTGVPVRKAIGRVYSRNAIQQLLKASSHEKQIDILVAELPVDRKVQNVDCKMPTHSLRRRLHEGITLLLKGTRLGTTFPLTLGGISAFLAVGTAIYAIAILVSRGETPEGWTTLMVVLGLGQAAILTMLSLIWNRLNSLIRGFQERDDATASVKVYSPSEYK